MTGDKQLEHLVFRLCSARMYSSEPRYYKVCEQCLVISCSHAGCCRACGAYRFDTSHKAVIESAKLIGSSPFPEGVVPRLWREQ
jgi:hypothetical protein